MHFYFIWRQLTISVELAWYIISSFLKTNKFVGIFSSSKHISSWWTYVPPSSFMFRRKLFIANFDLHNLGHVGSVQGIERGRKRREEGEGIPLFRSPPLHSLFAPSTQAKVTVQFILYVLLSNNQGWAYFLDFNWKIPWLNIWCQYKQESI